MKALAGSVRSWALACVLLGLALPSFGQANGTQKPETQTTQNNEMSANTQNAQTFQGTIDRSHNTYVLKDSSGTTYQLDDQKKAKDYAGQQVKVTGSLDTSSNTIHVSAIAPSS